jgi:hypothetical protein
LYRLARDGVAIIFEVIEDLPGLELELASIMEGVDYPWSTIVALVVAGLAFLYVTWRPEFSIRVHGGRCRYKGKLPIIVQKGLTQFLLDEVRPAGFIIICGRHRKGRLQLWYFGRLTPGEKQRIRNYLLTRL